ncbi:hypothetical protein NMG60_11005819 [Bertholletia excelsa]
MEKPKLEKDANFADVNVGTSRLRKQEYQADSDPFPGSKENEDAESKLVEFNSFVYEADSTDGRECKSLHVVNNPLEKRREDTRDPRTDLCGLDFEMQPLVVKDICMDREIPLQNKCSVEDCELDHGVITCLLNLDVDTDCKSTKDDIIKDAVQKLTGDVGEEKYHKVSISEVISATEARCSIGHDNGGIKSMTHDPLSSSSIAYSGPISHSGSISFRSNSSSNSTRSFAFPILSTDWNGSPVRMVESKGRHLKKHRRRGIGFLCCKF